MNNIGYTSRNSHPRFGIYRDNSPLWLPNNSNHLISRDHVWRNIKQGTGPYKTGNLKKIYSHRYKSKIDRSKTDNTYLESRIIFT